MILVVEMAFLAGHHIKNYIIIEILVILSETIGVFRKISRERKLSESNLSLKRLFSHVNISETVQINASA